MSPQAVFIGFALYKSNKMTDLQLMVNLGFPFLSLYFAGRLIYQRVTKRLKRCHPTCMLQRFIIILKRIIELIKVVSVLDQIIALGVHPVYKDKWDCIDAFCYSEVKFEERW